MNVLSLEYSIGIVVHYHFRYWYLPRSYDDKLVDDFILFDDCFLLRVRFLAENLMWQIIHFVEAIAFEKIRNNLNKKFCNSFSSFNFFFLIDKLKYLLIHYQNNAIRRGYCRILSRFISWFRNGGKTSKEVSFFLGGHFFG